VEALMFIDGAITRQINGRDVEIPFHINTDTGTYSQWGHDTLTFGENVDLLEALRGAAIDET
jgi:hypothetical protein